MKYKLIIALMVILLLNLIACANLSSRLLFTEEFPQKVYVDPSREVNITGPIRNLDYSIDTIIEGVREGVTEIFITIDSPGGRVDTTLKLIDVMKAAQSHGVRFTCIVTGRALSAAVILLSHCDSRYAIFGTRIMWHSVSFGRGVILRSANEASVKNLFKKIEDMNKFVWKETRSYFSKSYFDKHFAEETEILATEIEKNGHGFVTVIPNITHTPFTPLEEE